MTSPRLRATILTGISISSKNIDSGKFNLVLIATDVLQQPHYSRTFYADTDSGKIEIFVFFYHFNFTVKPQQYSALPRYYLQRLKC